MALSFATSRFFAVIRQTMNGPVVAWPQKWVKPRNVKVSGSRMVQKLKSCGLAVVVIQHSAESMAGLHRSAFRDVQFLSP